MMGIPTEAAKRALAESIERGWPTDDDLSSFEITPPGTDGAATLADGSVLRVVEGGGVTNEFLEYVMDAASPEDVPAIVRYVGPRLYWTADSG
jgi:hypothetical protein